MRRLLFIGFKDLLVQIRDFPALAVMLGMPMVLIFILGSALGGLTGGNSDIERINVAIVNLDSSHVADSVAEVFTDSEELRKLFDTREWDDEAEARTAVEQGDLAAALVIPKGFGADVEAAKAVKLQVLTDPGQGYLGPIFRGVVDSVATRISAASVAAQTTGALLGESRMVVSAEDVAGYVDRAAEAATAEDALDTVEIVQSDVSDSQGGFDALDYYAGGMSVMFLLFGAMFGAFSIVRERRDQTLARVLSTPTPRWAIVGGKMLGVYAIGLLQFACLWVFTLSLGVNWGSSALGVWLLIAGELLAVTGLSMTISAFAHNERQVGAIGPVVIQILAAAGGSFVPLQAFPKWLQPLHFATPNGWALDGLVALRAGGTLPDVLPNVAALLVIAAVLALVGTRRLRLE